MKTRQLSRPLGPTQTIALLILGLAMTGSLLKHSTAQGQVQSAPGKLTPKNAERFAAMLDQDWKQKPEWAVMLSDLLLGKPMGPNVGWFRDSEKRIGWNWVAEKFDVNNDAKISPAEAVAFAKVFPALDKNKDGGITEIDFDWRDVSHVGPSKPSEAIFYMLDRDSNGRVDREEILQMLAILDKDRQGTLTPDEFSNGFRAFDDPPEEPNRQAQRNDPNQYLNMLFNGDLGHFSEGPRLGQMAPDFDLLVLQPNGKPSDSKIKLSSFRNRKIVILNFGSFT